MAKNEPKKETKEEVKKETPKAESKKVEELKKKADEVIKKSNEIPPPPEMDKMHGCKTPEYVEWLEKYNPPREVIERHLPAWARR